MKNKLKEKDDIIDELKKQEKTQEAKIMTLQNDNLNISKMRTIETKLRSEIEGLKHENELIREDNKKSEESMKSHILVLENELKQEKMTKENILNDVSELSKTHSVNKVLEEEYVFQLREVEKENSNLNETLTKMREDKSKLIEKHKEELVNMSQSNIKMIEMMKSSKQNTIFKVDQKSVKSLKNDLMSSLMIELMKMNDETNNYLIRLATDEQDEVDMFKKRMEDSVRLLNNGEYKSEEQKQINDLRKTINSLEDIILEQNDMIHELQEYCTAATRFTTDSSIQLGEIMIDQYQDTNESLDGYRRFMKSCIVNLNEVLRNYQDDIKRIHDYLSRVDGFEKNEASKSLVETIRDFVLQFNSMKKDKLVKEGEMSELNSSKEELIVKLEEIVQELQTKNTEIDLLNEEFEDMEQENKHLVDQANQLSNQLEDQRKKFTSKIAELETENAKLIEKCGDIALRSVQKLKNKEEDSYRSKDDRELHYQLKQLKNEISSLEYKLKEKGYDNENLISQLNQKKEKINLLMTEQHAFKEKESSLISEIHQLRKENQDLKKNSMAINSTSDDIDFERSLGNYGAIINNQNRYQRRNNEKPFRYNEHDRRPPILEDRPIQKRYDHNDNDSYEDLDDFERKLLSNDEFD